MCKHSSKMMMPSSEYQERTNPMGIPEGTNHLRIPRRNQPYGNTGTEYQEGTNPMGIPEGTNLFRIPRRNQSYGNTRRNQSFQNTKKEPTFWEYQEGTNPINSQTKVSITEGVFISYYTDCLFTSCYSDGTP